MKGFRNTTRTVSGHGNWDGGSIGRMTGGTINRLARGGPVKGGDKIDESPGHPEVYPPAGDRTHGNSATQRKVASTVELEEHGGKSPLPAGFKKGGSAHRHFHVHHHHHAKGGKVKTSTKSYNSVERTAEQYAEGGHIHDETHIPTGYPDYAKGGRTGKKWIKGAIKHPGALHRSLGVPEGKKIPAKKLAQAAHSQNPTTRRRAALAKTLGGIQHKNAGGALYATGGGVQGLAGGGAPAMPVGTMGRLAMAPRVPLRRPMPLPGGPRAPFVTAAEGGATDHLQPGVNTSSPNSPGVLGAIRDAANSLSDYFVGVPQRETQAIVREREDRASRGQDGYARGGRFR